MKGTTMKTTILILALFTAICYGYTDISGDLSGVLTAAGSPYHVIDDIRVAPYDTLIIEPGCSLIFQVPPYHKFVVDTGAVIKAIGTESDSIVFTAADTIIGWLGMMVYYADSACSLSYCVIEYGKARASETEGNGGGVYARSTCLNVSNCYFYRDSASANGGAIYAMNTDLFINNCLFKNNSSMQYGGAMYTAQSNIFVSNSEFIENRAESSGGGIFLWSGSCSIGNCVFQTNYAGFSGGGIRLNVNPSILKDNIFEDNTANGLSYSGGGALHIDECDPQVVRNIFINNHATRDGGGILVRGSSPLINNNLIALNTAGNDGGGLCSDSWDNPILINNTFYRNFAQDYGGAINTTGNDDPFTVIFNCIFYQDSSGSPTRWEVYGEGSFSNCLVDSSLCSGSGINWHLGNIYADPLFADSLCHLSTTSPCINTGASWAYFSALDTFIYADSIDFEGDLRPLNGSWEIGCDEIDTTLLKILDNYRRPSSFKISPYPNPFNSAVSITAPAGAEIEIYDIEGRRISVIPDPDRESRGMAKNLDSRFHGNDNISEFTWQPSPSIGSGIYLVRAIRDEQEVTKRIVYLK